MSEHTNTYAKHSDRYDGWVYLAKSDTGHFKVGRSVKPADRISHFDTQMPVEVSEWCRFAADDYKRAESDLYKICNRHGEHVNGEWWELPEYLIWWIKSVSVYEEGKFLGGWYLYTELEEPSESSENFEKHFGARSHRAAPPMNSAFFQHG